VGILGLRPLVFFTCANGSDVGRVSATFVCLSVCFSVRCIKKPMQLGSPTLTQNFFTVSPGNAFMFGVRRSRSQGTINIAGMGQNEIFCYCQWPVR